MDDFAIVRSDGLDGVPHGFFGHAGGKHQFGFGGPGDEAAVQDLRRAAAEALSPGAVLVAPHQVHSPDVVTVENAWGDTSEGRPVADALVTGRGGIALGIVTADCAPVLFADRNAGVIGAAHAGWRGAHGGVLENTISAMERLGASRPGIAATIGPTIAQPSYEVDEAFREQFDLENQCHFMPAPYRDGAARYLFDLPGYIAGRLAAAGTGQVEDLAVDTFPPGSGYHSYRRATQQGEANYGRQISIIALP